MNNDAIEKALDEVADIAEDAGRSPALKNAIGRAKRAGCTFEQVGRATADGLSRREEP